MAVDRGQAKKDHAAKLRLEAWLRPRLSNNRKSLAKEITQSLGRTGELPDVASISIPGLEPILREHYERVGEAFSGTIGSRLPRELRATSEEEEEISRILGLFFSRTAPEQAREIAVVDEKNAKRAQSIAAMERSRLEREEDREVSKSEEAAIVGAILTRQLNSRVARIAVRETQSAGEATKMAEISILLDLGDLANLGGEAEEAPAAPPPGRIPIKEWVSQGDSRVRTPPEKEFDHLRADSGQVPVNEPFVVSGEELMFPGDESLGASKGNIMGCRCSSQVDVDEVASARMEMR